MKWFATFASIFFAILTIICIIASIAYRENEADGIVMDVLVAINAFQMGMYLRWVLDAWREDDY